MNQKTTGLRKNRKNQKKNQKNNAVASFRENHAEVVVLASNL